MRAATELYEAATRLYRQGDFVAAEQGYRNLLQVVSGSEGPDTGRAWYGLALALLGQARTAEARAALESALAVDPSLERARERLESLDAAEELDDEVAQAGELGSRSGPASHVRLRIEPNPWIAREQDQVLTFRINLTATKPARQVEVTLRGRRIVGSVVDGDIIELPDGWTPGAAVTRVRNLTTNTTVHVTRAGRVVQWVILAVFLTAFALFAIFVISNMNPRP